MKKLIKILALIMTVLLVLSVLVACKNDSGDENENNEKTESPNGSPASGRTLDSIRQKAEKFASQGYIEVEISTEITQKPEENAGLEITMHLDTDYGDVYAYQYNTNTAANAAYQAKKELIASFVDDSDTETYVDGNIVIIGDCDALAYIWFDVHD